MHCNQRFCGNGFNNGQYYGHNPCNPSPPYSGFGPEIVGEGDVTAIALPDGTCQFFFMPTIKWWTPLNANTPPYYTNIVNTTYSNPYWNPNTSAWFVRTITNPRTQHSPVINPLYQNYDVPRLSNSSHCNLNPTYPGYQLKFHSDKWTSTTDILYFYPRLRQYDCTITPTKGSAAVQVDTQLTNNTICHCEFVCTKPCHCSFNPDNAPPKPASAMSLIDAIPSFKDICEYCFPSSDKQAKSETKSNNIKLHLVPSDVGNRRIKLENKKKIPKAKKKIPKAKKKSKNTFCESIPPPSVNKSTATYNDKSSESHRDRNIETPRREQLTSLLLCDTGSETSCTCSSIDDV